MEFSEHNVDSRTVFRSATKRKIFSSRSHVTLPLSGAHLFLLMQFPFELLVNAVENDPLPPESVNAFSQILVERQRFVELYQRLLGERHPNIRGSVC